MPLEVDRLLAVAIQSRQTLTRRSTAFYALSVGVGQDPVDEAQLAFVDPARDLVALPSLATVLAYPGLWLADPVYGANFSQAVNGGQSVVLHRPLPVEAELAGMTRVTGIVDKGPGKGAIVSAERVVTDAATGEPLATIGQTTFLRGDGGFGGLPGPVQPPHPLPAGAPRHTVELETRPEQALFYRFNGDDNPLHADPRAAARAGFPKPILHGLCTFGVVTHALVRALCRYDPARLRSFEARFSAPVYPGETIRTQIWADGSFQARVVERDVVVVTHGHAHVIT
jgi:acyl dehydratase